MIWDSEYYKEELNVIADRFEKRKDFQRWTERSCVLVEKDFFVAFFYIRKLIEAKTKLSDNTISRMINVKFFLAKDKNATLMNHYKIDELFDFCTENRGSIGLEHLCNQLIHSYVFEICLNIDGKGLSGLFFCSDRNRNRKLYFIEIDTIIKLLKTVGGNYPACSRMVFEPELKDYRVSYKTPSDLDFQP